MAGLVHSIEELVGRTPLMELDRFERQQQCGAHLLAKLEFFNPTGSVKDRAALSMLNAAGGRTVSGHTVKLKHKCQFWDEVGVISHLMHIIMLVRSRLIDVPKRLTGKFFYCSVVFFCF